MNIMNIANITELISAFAAFLTVSLAFVELSFRSKAKKADLAMDIYSDYLYIKQQLMYAVNDARVFTQNINTRSEAELIAYAQNHAVEPNLFVVIPKFTKECISSFEIISEKTKSTSKLILDVTGEITNLLHFIDSFLCTYTAGGSCNKEQLQKNYQYIENVYQDVLPSMDAIGEILKGNLKKTHSNSNLYLTILIVVAIVLLCVCFLI